MAFGILNGIGMGVQEGRSLRVRTGLFWQSSTGEWTRYRPGDCVKPVTEGQSSP